MFLCFFSFKAVRSRLVISMIAFYDLFIPRQRQGRQGSEGRGPHPKRARLSLFRTSSNSSSSSSSASASVSSSSSSSSESPSSSSDSEEEARSPPSSNSEEGRPWNSRTKAAIVDILKRPFVQGWAVNSQQATIAYVAVALVEIVTVHRAPY
eukprot:g9592.t1